MDGERIESLPWGDPEAKGILCATGRESEAYALLGISGTPELVTSARGRDTVTKTVGKMLETRFPDLHWVVDGEVDTLLGHWTCKLDYATEIHPKFPIFQNVLAALSRGVKDTPPGTYVTIREVTSIPYRISSWSVYTVRT